jgi:hypothetical protein
VETDLADPIDAGIAQRGIGMTHQRLRIAAVEGIHGDPDAGADFGITIAGQRGRGQRADDAIAEHAGAARLIAPELDDREIAARQPRDDILIASRRAKTIGRIDHQRIRDRPTLARIGGVKPVQSNPQQRDVRLVLAARASARVSWASWTR